MQQFGTLLVIKTQGDNGYSPLTGSVTHLTSSIRELHCVCLLQDFYFTPTAIKEKIVSNLNVNYAINFVITCFN